MTTIPNNDLRIEIIPTADADVRAIMDFALTFNGYDHWDSFEKCAEIANAREVSTLTNVRTCLFFEQRRWRHFGYGPDEVALAYWRRLVELVRRKVQANEFL